MTHTSTLVNEHKHYMDKTNLRAQLPRVGDIRWETQTMGKDGGFKPVPQRRKVIAVNLAHLWYMVQFENGFRECYKLPRHKPAGGAAK